MIVCSCPRCDEAFRIPSGNIPDDAYAECPWCHESFPASEFLEKLPPIVALTSSMGLPLHASDAEAQDFSSGINQPAEDAYGAGDQFGNESAAVEPSQDFSGFSPDANYDDNPGPSVLPPADSDLVEPEFQLNDESGAPIAGNTLAPMKVGPAHVTTSRPRRKKGSPIKGMIGVIFGGLLALPIAGGILLAFGKAPNLGFYPFDGSFSATSSRRPAPPIDPIDSNTSSNSGSSGRSLGSDLSLDIPSVEDANSDPAADALRELGITPANGAADALSDVSADATPDDSGVSPENAGMSSAELPGDLETDTVGTPDAGIAFDGQAITPPPLAPFTDVAAESNVTEVAEPEISLPTEMEQPAELGNLVSESVDSEIADLNADPQLMSGSNESTEPADVGNADANASNPTFLEPQASLAATPAVPDSPELLSAARSAFDSVADARGVGPNQKAFRGAISSSYIKLAAAASLIESNDSTTGQELLDTVRQSGLQEYFGAAAEQWLNISAEKRPSLGIVVDGTIGDNGNQLQLPSGASVRISSEKLSAPPTGAILGLGKIKDTDDGPVVILSAISSGK